MNKDQTLCENTTKIKRSALWESIFNLTKQIPRLSVEEDAMDAPSCATEIEAIANKYFSAQYEKLIGECMPKEEFGIACRDREVECDNWNAAIRTIRTSLQERGIIIK